MSRRGLAQRRVGSDPTRRYLSDPIQSKSQASGLAGIIRRSIMANLNVTYDDLRDAARRLQVGKDDLHTKLTDLSNLIHELTANGFQAEQSSAAYRDSFEQFRTGTSQAIDGLDGLANFLVSEADALQRSVRGLGNGIGD